MPDRGLVKDKSDCGDPGQPEGWEGNQESVLFTGQDFKNNKETNCV